MYNTICYVTINQQQFTHSSVSDFWDTIMF